MFFRGQDWSGTRHSVSFSRFSCWCNNFLFARSCMHPHASHMVWGALHFRGIAHVVALLSLPCTSHRCCIGLLLLSLSSRAIISGEAYLNLETARESRGLFKGLNAFGVPLAVRLWLGLCSCSLSWRKPFGSFSALASSLGLTSPFGDYTHFAVDGIY